MKYDDKYRSSNVEDRRGEGGGGGRIGLPVGKLGIGGTVIVLLLSLVFGRNFLGGLTGSSSPDPNAPRDPDEEKLVGLVSTVLDDAQANWKKILPAQAQKPYRDAKLVLFTDSVKSGCGFAESAMGPFYCPADEKIYIDLGFYRALKQKLGAPGDYAQAYVIAHEVGHHVQNVLGTEETFRNKQRGMSKTEQNELSVRMELQADCYAGIWAKMSKDSVLYQIEPGDLDEAIGAAEAVGDDRLQKSATGQVNPEKWTHGSAAMRARWFNKGKDSGQLASCDTFGAASL